MATNGGIPVNEPHKLFDTILVLDFGSVLKDLSSLQSLRVV